MLMTGESGEENTFFCLDVDVVLPMSNCDTPSTVGIFPLVFELILTVNNIVHGFILAITFFLSNILFNDRDNLNHWSWYL